MPDLHEKESALKPRFYPEGYTPRDIKKNPDAWIKSKQGEDMVCDFKVLTSERSFAHRIVEASEQADYAVVKFDFEPEKLGANNIQHTVNRKLNEINSLKGVIVIDKDGALLYDQYR